MTSTTEGVTTTTETTEPIEEDPGLIGPVGPTEDEGDDNDGGGLPVVPIVGALALALIAAFALFLRSRGRGDRTPLAFVPGAEDDFFADLEPFAFPESRPEPAPTQVTQAVVWDEPEPEPMLEPEPLPEPEPEPEPAPAPPRRTVEDDFFDDVDFTSSGNLDPDVPDMNIDMRGPDDL